MPKTQGRDVHSRGATLDDTAWDMKVERNEGEFWEAGPQEAMSGDEDHETRHDEDWFRGHEQDARAEKERMARMRKVAWCDFCGGHAQGRRCCYGCKQIGVKTYYCDRQCQVAAWRLQPKHRCGR